MGQLVDGQWRTENILFNHDDKGLYFKRDSVFRDRVSSDAGAAFPAEPGRYHLYCSVACPWAHRTTLMRTLKKLEPFVTLTNTFQEMGGQGWSFGEAGHIVPGTDRRVRFLHELYTIADPACTTRVTVPTLWDAKTCRVVNNESSEIIRMLNNEFGGVGAEPTDYYPAALRGEIDRINDLVYANVNNGVYRCGFARTQAAYEASYDALFAALDELEARLGRQRYLVGRQITEADWRLFPTLVRFDVAYFSLFKCNRNRIADFPNLSNYMRELYQVPGVAETVKPRYYVINYYSIARANPNGIIPKGTPVDYLRPHDRARFAA